MLSYYVEELKYFDPSHYILIPPGYNNIRDIRDITDIYIYDFIQQKTAWIIGLQIYYYSYSHQATPEPHYYSIKIYFNIDGSGGQLSSDE